MKTLLTIQADEHQKINDQNDQSNRQKLIDELKRFVEHWHKFDECYFWSPPMNASGRRSEEKRNYLSIDIVIDNIRIVGEIRVSCSCKNYYCYKSLSIDGTKKTIRSLNKFLK